MHQCVKDTFNGKVTKTDITNSVLAKVRNSGDGYGTECISFPTDKIFDTEEKAVDFIDDYVIDLDRNSVTSANAFDLRPFSQRAGYIVVAARSE